MYSQTKDRHRVLMPTELRLFGLGLVVLVVCTMVANPHAGALPIFDENECTSAFNIPSGWLDDGTEAINYYVHTDFAQKFVECSNNENYDGEITQLHMTGLVKRAAEIWNTQSRSAALVYRGHTSHHAQEGFCDDPSIEKPAVHIDFRIGCRITNGCVEWDECANDGDGDSCECDSSHCTGAFGAIKKIEDCGDAMLIEIHGDPDKAFECTDEGHPADEPAHPWNVVPDDSWGRQFINIMVHEFGHVLGVGHPPSQSTGHSIMDPGGSETHLGTWDKDCVDDPLLSDSRFTRYQYQGYSGSAGWSGQQTYVYGTQRGSMSDLVWSHDSITMSPIYATQYKQYPTGHPNYSTTPPGYAIWAEYSATGDAPYSDYNSLSNAVQSLDTTPFLFDRSENFGSDDSQRINYAWDSSSSEPHPPYLRYRRSGNAFETADGGGTYRGCSSAFGSGGTCSSPSVLRSSVSLVHTYDMYSGTDIFAEVKHIDLLGGGFIVIHPGFDGTSKTTLRTGSLFGSHNTSMVSSPSGTLYSYSFETDFAPGIACAPNRRDFQYNCVLAWADRAVPKGRIHYTYFRINPSTKTVEWHGTAWTRSGSRTTSHVSAGFFDDSFWLGLKHWTNPQRVTRSRNQGSYASWSNDTFARPTIVDPSFFS